MRVRSKLKAQRLLLIAPHFGVFIKDQAVLIRSHLSSMTVLLPIPYFSSLVLKLPFFKRYFRFLELPLESFNELGQNYTIIPSRFFTLPIEELQKRNCYLATASSIKALSKNAIDFNLIHAHFLDNGFIGAKLKSLSGKPLVVTAHGGDVYSLPFRNNWYNSLARYVLHEADQVITVSRFNAGKLSTLGVPSNKLHVIPNGYDNKLFKPLPLVKARKKLHMPLNKKILLSVGNLVDMKGHTYLIGAMKFVLKTYDDIILVIVGSGLMSDNLGKKTKELNLEKKVFFVGRKKHEEIPVWMNSCDIFVLPSLNEGFPTVIPEAMACGKPIVGTTVGGVPEAISNKEVGILSKPKDSEALASSILDALDKDWEPEIIINYAKQYVWSNLIKQILEVYQAL